MTDVFAMPTYSDAELRYMAMRQFGVEIPEGATDIKLTEERRFREIGRRTRLYPDEQFSVGLFVHRNPTYTVHEEAIIVTEGMLVWKIDGQRQAARVTLS